MLHFINPGFFILTLIVCTSLPGRAQISDDFSDGNFTVNPAWQGDLSHFVVDSTGALQLKAPDAGFSVISVAGNIPDSTVWTCTLRLAFAPSASNLLRIYLQADSGDLAAAHGYFLEIGENGNLDAFRFFRQDGISKTLLASGVPGFVSADPVELQFRMRRTKAGLWSLWAGPPGSNLMSQLTAADATYSGGMGLYFGFYCLYTTTRKDRFYFDDISVLPDIPDTLPPDLVSAESQSDSVLTVVFNEPLETTSGANTDNYEVLPGIGSPVHATLLPDRKTVRLVLNPALQTGTYTLQVDSIRDLAGNISGLRSVVFLYTQTAAASEFDILLNEIMADPAPSAGLPEVEWVELYNRSGQDISLEGLLIDDGGPQHPLPAYLLGSKQFVLLCAPASAPVLANLVQNLLPVPGFPTLNNDGDVLTLRLAGGAIIDQVGYSVDWHNDPVKKSGGWSLERINPLLPCQGKENWQSCPALPGGTPGKANAALSLAPDQMSPEILSVYPQDSVTVVVEFSEGMGQTGTTNPGAYTITPNAAITAATRNGSDKSSLTLHLATPLQPGIVYSLSTNGMVADCAGNALDAGSVRLFGLPEQPEPGDIVINEVLFNPLPYGDRYVELINRSKKIFSWVHFFLASFYKGSDTRPIALPRLLLPGQIDVFTTSPDDIKARFQHIHPDHLMSLDLPAMADDAGNITLYWANNGKYIGVDSFDYNQTMHNPLFSASDREGVALERISPGAPSNAAGSWTSAASVATGAPGTPTLPNSQLAQQDSILSDGDWISFPVARLSPDGDGYEDFLEINYLLPVTGYEASITIFDSGGIPIKRLMRTALAGATGLIRWDGDTDNGARARPGIYIVDMELFDPSGSTRSIKKPVALVSKN